MRNIWRLVTLYILYYSFHPSLFKYFWIPLFPKIAVLVFTYMRIFFNSYLAIFGHWWGSLTQFILLTAKLLDQTKIHPEPPNKVKHLCLDNCMSKIWSKKDTISRVIYWICKGGPFLIVQGPKLKNYTKVNIWAYFFHLLFEDQLFFIFFFRKDTKFWNHQNPFWKVKYTPTRNPDLGIVLFLSHRYVSIVSYRWKILNQATAAHESVAQI